VRAIQRDRRDHGAVAVLTAIVLTFALLPAMALGTGTYVRSSTATELQRASDSGALAGAAQIPLGNTTFVTDYLNDVTGGGLSAPLSALGLNDPNAPDPLVQACKVAVADASNPDNLGHAYATMSASPCAAKYLPNDSVLSQLTSCVADLGPGNVTGGLVGLLNGLLGGLGIGGLDSTLGSLLPALLDPGIQVTMNWHVKAPFDSVFGSNGQNQTSTSIARRRFKNVLVVPITSLQLGSSSPITINPNTVLQPLTATVFKTLTGLENTLSGLANNFLLHALAPDLSLCVSALQNLQGDLSDLIDPPSSGPDLTSLLTDAATSDTPVLALLEGTDIPFLDFVPVCIPNVTNIYSAVQATATNLGCLLDAPGVFRASLRNS
jgi:Flp pilus assembly protein TadG